MEYTEEQIKIMKFAESCKAWGLVYMEWQALVQRNQELVPLLNIKFLIKLHKKRHSAFKVTTAVLFIIAIVMLAALSPMIFSNWNKGLTYAENAEAFKYIWSMPVVCIAVIIFLILLCVIRNVCLSLRYKKVQADNQTEYTQNDFQLNKLQQELYKQEQAMLMDSNYSIPKEYWIVGGRIGELIASKRSRDVTDAINIIEQDKTAYGVSDYICPYCHTRNVATNIFSEYVGYGGHQHRMFAKCKRCGRSWVVR